MTTLKATWTVRVGMFPGEVESMRELHKQWFYTSEDYIADVAATAGEEPGPQPGKPPTRFETCRDEAQQYWREMVDPRRLNWADLTFVWM